MHPHFSLTKKLESQNLLIKRKTHIWIKSLSISATALDHLVPDVSWWHLSSVILIIVMSRCHVALVPGSHLMSQCHIFQLKWGKLWVVTADPGVTCPLSKSDVAPVLYQSPDTGDPSRDQEKGKGEKETQINCKIWPPSPPTRYLSTTSRGLIGHNWDPRHVSGHVSRVCSRG